MKEHPILFSASMVRAILEGRKTQTRRVVKPQPIAAKKYVGGGFVEHRPNRTDGGKDRTAVGAPSCFLARVSPYGGPGDRLWVRETWGIAGDMPHDPGYVEYRADCSGNFNEVGDLVPRWRPSIHMRREDSRITLEITDVRVQRVQDISEADALAEGCRSAIRHSAVFADLWDSINARRGFGWNANPWVWVLTFKRVEQSA